MSSISASDRARQVDEVRRVREDAESKETSKAKKQKEELKRLQQKYSEQVKDLEESYDTRVDSLRKHNKEALSDRDNSHQQQIDKIRGLYQEQLARKTEDNDGNRKTQRETYKAEMEKQKAIQKQQIDNLSDSHLEELRERDRVVEEHSLRARDEIRNSIAERTRKLNNKHEAEMEATTKDRDSIKGELTREMAQQRALHKNQEKTLKRQHENEKDRINEGWKGTLLEKEGINSTILRNRDLLLQAEKEDLREKYRNKIDEKTAQLEETRESLQEEASGRRAREINSAKASISAARSRAVQDNLTNERLRKMEKENIVRSYENRMQDLERQTSELKESSNHLTQKRVNIVLDNAEKTLNQQSTRAKMDQQMALAKHREDRENILQSTANQIEATEKKTEQRLKRVTADARDENQVQKEVSSKNLAEVKNNYFDQLTAQRSAHIESLSEMRGSMEQRMRDNQVKSQKKIEDLTEFYEKKIKGLEEQHKESMVRMKKAFDTRTESLEKAHDIDQKQVAQKYDIKFDSQQQETQKELDRLQKKHELEMANLATRVNLKKKG